MGDERSYIRTLHGLRRKQSTVTNKAQMLASHVAEKKSATGDRTGRGVCTWNCSNRLRALTPLTHSHPHGNSRHGLESQDAARHTQRMPRCTALRTAREAWSTTHYDIHHDGYHVQAWPTSPTCRKYNLSDHSHPVRPQNGRSGGRILHKEITWRPAHPAISAALCDQAPSGAAQTTPKSTLMQSATCAFRSPVSHITVQ